MSLMSFRRNISAEDCFRNCILPLFLLADWENSSVPPCGAKSMSPRLAVRFLVVKSLRVVSYSLERSYLNCYCFQGIAY